MPGALGGASFKHRKKGKKFYLLSVDAIVDAFVRRTDGHEGEVTFVESRLGQAFQWGFTATLKDQVQRHQSLMEIQRLDIFSTASG